MVLILSPLLLSLPAQALYGNKNLYWKTGSKSKPVMIPVCWENPASASAQRRGWAQSAVEASWQRHARVNFVEWDSCKKGDRGLHILITNTSMMPGGKTLNGKTNGGKLDLSYSGGPTGCQRGSAALQHCIAAVAAHEVGHVLGFYHEEERPDYVEPPGTPPKAPCAKQSFKNSKPQYYGAFDIDSVMSYCGQPAGNPSTWKEGLSPGDVASVQRAYGRRIPGSLVSPGGNCLAAHESAKTLEEAFLWDCDEARNDQEWRLNSFTDGTLRLGPDRCLQAKSTQRQVRLGYCATKEPGQRWRLEEIRLSGFGGQCLDLRAGRTIRRTPIQMWACGALDGANQRWRITAQREIEFASSGMCLTLPESGTANLNDCAQPDLQRFSFAAAGQIRLLSQPGKCLDVQGWTDAQYLAGNGLPTNGQRLQRFTCLEAQLNQRWNLTGPVHHSTELCLERAGGSETNGTGVEIAPCTTSAAQRWDYYWRP